MGAQVRIRCWARSAKTGALCSCDANHSGVVHGRNDGDLWFNANCAPNADSTGRETAALRILEVSHEVDRLMFLAGEHSTDAVRSIAARLMTGTRAAKLDLMCIESWLTMNEGAPGCHELLRQAADLLRPFADRA